MAGITGKIEEFIVRMLDDADDGILEIGRNELAHHFNCAPSQINYVLTTRFTPYNGYYIESRRGGCGYIRIIKMEKPASETFEQLIHQVVQDEITADKVHHILTSLLRQEAITDREYKLMKHATDDQALRIVEPQDRNRVRAQILKNMLFVF